MPKQSFNSKEIIRLLSELKSETPEYPTELLEARKAAFLKQAATLNIPGKGPGGEGGQQGGGSGSGGAGPALGGGTAAQGFVLQALVGFSVIAALLLTAFAYREQIGEILRNRSENVAIVETGTLADALTGTAIATVSPELTVSPMVGTPTPTGTSFEEVDGEIIIVVDGTLYVNGTPIVIGTPTGTKTNSGLHLGQTPGTPAAPGQGNPGNPNQPDKPTKPVKPTKADNSNKPQKTDNPNKK